MLDDATLSVMWQVSKLVSSYGASTHDPQHQHKRMDDLQGSMSARQLGLHA
jgi:hypothetical protein